MKRVLYIGDFKASYSTERYVANALKELGYEVMCKQEDNMMVHNIDGIVAEIKEWNPILVLFSKGKPVGYPEQFIEALKKAKINTATWLFDLYFGLPVDRLRKLQSRQAPYNVETIYSTDGGHDEEWKAMGINHKLLRQGIHKKEAVMCKMPKTRSIIFVGGDAFNNRGWIVNGLQEKYGERFEWWGQPHNRIRGLPLNELYGSSKVVVGDSQPSKNYWSNRVYETLGRGGFLLHPFVEGIDSEFIDKKHLVLYDRDSPQDLHDKIDYYLRNEKEREAIRLAGFEYVRDNLTYTHRCRELMKNYDTELQQK